MALNETIVTGKYFRQLVDKTTKKWERYSLWSKASDTECDDGTSVETKVGAIKGITTSTNVTKTGYAFDAKAATDKFTELNNSLIDIYVGDDGKLHKVQGGADSVLPFSGEKKISTESVRVASGAVSGYKSVTKTVTLHRTNKTYVGIGGISNGNFNVGVNSIDVTGEVLTVIFNNPVGSDQSTTLTFNILYFDD